MTSRWWCGDGDGDGDGDDTPAVMTGTFYGLEFLKIRVSAPVFTKRFPWLSEQSIWSRIDQSPQCGVSGRGKLDRLFIHSFDDLNVSLSIRPRAARFTDG